MNTTAVQRVELQQILREIPDDRLEEVQQYLTSITPAQKKERGSLAGIWKGLGFEKLDETLEEEIKKLRKQTSSAILAKDYS